MKIHELGHVVLYVSQLERSAYFYREILGFNEIHRDTHTAFYSSMRTHHEMLLIEVGGEKEKKQGSPSPGLYHIGFKIGENDDDLRQALNELTEKGIAIIGTANHHVTHSIYIEDPDGNELELYIDVDDSWKKDPKKILERAQPLIL